MMMTVQGVGGRGGFVLLLPAASLYDVLIVQETLIHMLRHPPLLSTILLLLLLHPLSLPPSSPDGTRARASAGGTCNYRHNLVASRGSRHARGHVGRDFAPQHRPRHVLLVPHHMLNPLSAHLPILAQAARPSLTAHRPSPHLRPSRARAAMALLFHSSSCTLSTHKVLQRFACAAVSSPGPPLGSRW